MTKRVDFIRLDEATDTREHVSTQTADLYAVVTDETLVGWGRATHTVMAAPTGHYLAEEAAGAAHAVLTDEEAATLPHYASPTAFRRAIDAARYPAA